MAITIITTVIYILSYIRRTRGSKDKSNRLPVSGCFILVHTFRESSPVRVSVVHGVRDFHVKRLEYVRSGEQDRLYTAEEGKKRKKALFGVTLQVPAPSCDNLFKINKRIEYDQLNVVIYVGIWSVKKKKMRSFFRNKKEHVCVCVRLRMRTNACVRVCIWNRKVNRVLYRSTDFPLRSTGLTWLKLPTMTTKAFPYEVTRKSSNTRKDRACSCVPHPRTSSRSLLDFYSTYSRDHTRAR